MLKSICCALSEVFVIAAARTSTRFSISIGMRLTAVTVLYVTFTPSFLAIYLTKSMSYPSYAFVFGFSVPNGGRVSLTPATRTPFAFTSASVSPARAGPHSAPNSASAAIVKKLFLIFGSSRHGLAHFEP